MFYQYKKNRKKTLVAAITLQELRTAGQCPVPGMSIDDPDVDLHAGIATIQAAWLVLNMLLVVNKKLFQESDVESIASL